MTALVGVGVVVNAPPSSVNKLEQQLETEPRYSLDMARARFGAQVII